MATIIKVPTWVTFNKIPYGTPSQGLAVLNAALGTSLVAASAPGAPDGSSNPMWPDLQDLDLGGGHLRYRGNTMDELAEFVGIENTSFLTIPYIQLAVAIGGEVENYGVMLELPANLDAEVPASFPNRSYATIDDSDPENPVESTVVHTYATYFPEQLRKEVEGTVYVPAQAYAGRLTGDTFKASEWVASGLTVLTRSQFQAILPAPETV